MSVLYIINQVFETDIVKTELIKANVPPQPSICFQWLRHGHEIHGTRDALVSYTSLDHIYVVFNFLMNPKLSERFSTFSKSLGFWDAPIIQFILITVMYIYRQSNCDKILVS